ncbi:MAG: hypothetical protein AAB400_01930 [Patescibacteria group bacterium]
MALLLKGLRYGFTADMLNDRRISHLFYKSVIGTLIIAAFPLYAQEAPRSSDVEELQTALHTIERQIVAYEKNLSITKRQRVAIGSLLETLKAQRISLQEQIRLSERSRDALQDRIDAVITDIDAQEQRVEKARKELSELLHMLRQNASRSSFESFVVHASLSAYLDEQEQTLLLLRILHLRYLSFKTILFELNQKKNELDSYVRELEHTLKKKSIQQGQVDQNSRLQTVLLSKTKEKEKTTAQQLSESKKKARAIRGRIYELFNVGKQINFGAAYEMAQWVGSQYHIRPAYLLAVLTQESNLGKNVGTCNRATDPPEKHWKVIMKPTRDHKPFLQITKELGLDPDTTPVSCPMIRNGKQIGWGGAMGPAQFIPSTWMGYRDKVRTVTGGAANPWNIRDAFIAAAIKLSSDGARNSEQSEFNAALRYFSGSVNLTYRFYGDNVLAIAERYEQDIKQLEALPN